MNSEYQTPHPIQTLIQQPTEICVSFYSGIQCIPMRFANWTVSKSI